MTDNMNHQKQKDRWVGMACYLDGKRASITGRQNQFATVAALDGSQSCEFSWEAVDRIMYGKMEFHS